MVKMIKACLLLCCLAGCSSEAFHSDDGGSDAGAGGEDGGGGGEEAACGYVEVVSAVFGANCEQPTQLQSVADQCDGADICTYVLDVDQDPGFDPASGCWKDLTVVYRCSATSQEMLTVTKQNAWTGTKVELNCC